MEKILVIYFLHFGGMGPSFAFVVAICIIVVLTKKNMLKRKNPTK